LRIEEIHIDGFGIFHDMTIAPVPPGLSVFRGENEAGKTTLLAFLRHMLFGFPDGRSKENRYPPVRGGKHGGQIVMVSASGDRFVVERHPGHGGGRVNVTLPSLDYS